MKKTGLKNRFPKDVMEWWKVSDWNDCSVCLEYGADCLHHIFSESSRFYKYGEFNKSILNSAPVHNHKCHIGNGAVLHKKKMIRQLLKETLKALAVVGYELKEIDKEFYEQYIEFYK